jgi:hypothetical protein
MAFEMATPDDDTLSLLILERLSRIVDRLILTIAPSYSINGVFFEALMTESNDYGCCVFDDFVQVFLNLLLCFLCLAQVGVRGDVAWNDGTKNAAGVVGGYCFL